MFAFDGPPSTPLGTCVGLHRTRSTFTAGRFHTLGDSCALIMLCTWMADGRRRSGVVRIFARVRQGAGMSLERCGA